MSEKDEKSDGDVQREAYVAALQREREGCERRGLSERVAAVDAELKRLGVSRPQAHKGVERAVTPPAERRRKAAG